MKQETKELIDWIKKQINLAKECCIDSAWNGQHKWYNADYEKAMNFLDSLPQIESRLCKGGYIQDKTGTPCCDGDKVTFKFMETEWTKDNIEKYGLYYNGVLKFDSKIKAWVIDYGENNEYWCDFICENDGIEWFEKIKE